MTNGFPTAAFPGEFESTTYQLSQDFDWVKDAHQLSFGGSWIRPGLDVIGPFQANGIFTFNGTRVGAGRLGLADLMLGLPSQFRQGGNQTRATRRSTTSVSTCRTCGASATTSR